MKTIKDFDLFEKKVIIRVDFNVPIKDGKIIDDTRIIESIPTIEYAITSGAKVILLSHLGRIKTADDLEKNNLKIVVPKLSKLLKQDVIFSPLTRGKKLEQMIDNLKSGQVLMIQNTRYEDLNGKKESCNDEELGKYWAKLGDIFINDAFGTSHRIHASNVGIASNIPSGIGFLMEKEVSTLLSIIKEPKRPFTVILGGSKVSDKIGVIENLVHIADYILIGGGMSYTFLKASGINIGSSLLEEEYISFCKKILEENKDKIVLPIDSIVAADINENATIRECFINEIKNNEMGLDIGYNTVKLFRTYLENSKTIIWNGPVGVIEIDKFSIGTKKICEIIKNIDAIKIAGGGDTASAIKNLGYESGFTYLSTGGGATLTILEGKDLPGIKVIEENEKKYN